MIKIVDNNYRQVKLRHGTLHVFANDEVFSLLEKKVFRMADNNLRIPKNVFMSYTPDAHVAAGTCVGTTALWRMNDGFVSPSIVGSDIGCGIRVHLTPMTKADIQDKKLRRKIIRSIEKYVPTKEHTSSSYKNIHVEKIVTEGITGLPQQYIPESKEVDIPQSITHVECDRFACDPKYLEIISDELWIRNKRHIGSLGGGNHFIELQYVAINPAKEEVAKKWGLFNDQIIVMIHSGSRSWGKTLRPIYTEDIKKKMETSKIWSPDPKLIFTPINSYEGQRYINLMYSALNYAVVNRHMIAYGVREGLKDVVGREFEMPVLYDLMHNYALEEPHDNKVYLCHRKGTTRALPKNHPLNREVYIDTGHPALIPGSMGTPSYIMVGEPSGYKNYYSICHGSGRVYSRGAAKQMVTVDQFSKTMKVGTEDEVIINRWTLESIIEEGPQAYKDVDQIIDSVVGAGLASVVAECKPFAVIKGM